MSSTYAIPKPAPFKSPLADDDLFYPDSDGEPMADNDQQYQTMVDVRFGLQQRYGNQNAYVGANLLIYFEEGDASKRVALDVFVALDVPPGLRRTYLIWTEGKPPDVVFEIASRRSWKADVGWKKGLYQGLGIREYFLFDPGGACFQPILQGYALDEESYRPIAPVEGQRGVLGVASAVLGLELWAQAGEQPEMPFVLRLWDPAASAWLPTPAGESARADAEALARAEAEDRAAAAEARLRELEAELRRLRGET